MNRDQAETFLRALGKTPRAGQKWVNASCPFEAVRHVGGRDTHPSFGVRLEPGIAFCQCFACAYHGDVSQLLSDMQEAGIHAEYRDAYAVIHEVEEEGGWEIDWPAYDDLGREDEIIAYPEWLLDGFEPVLHEGVLHPYLVHRRVDVWVARALDFRWDPFRSRIIVPIRDFRGSLCGIHGRSVGGGEPRYYAYGYLGRYNPQVWWGEHWVDFTSPVWVAESVFDLAAVFAFQQNVLSPLGATLSASKVARLRAMNPISVHTVFDGDPAGQRARIRLEQAMSPTPVAHCVPPSGMDAGGMDRSSLKQLIEE